MDGACIMQLNIHHSQFTKIEVTSHRHIDPYFLPRGHGDDRLVIAEKGKSKQGKLFVGWEKIALVFIRSE